MTYLWFPQSNKGWHVLQTSRNSSCLLPLRRKSGPADQNVCWWTMTRLSQQWRCLILHLWTLLVLHYLPWDFSFSNVQTEFCFLWPVTIASFPFAVCLDKSLRLSLLWSPLHKGVLGACSIPPLASFSLGWKNLIPSVSSFTSCAPVCLGGCPLHSLQCVNVFLEWRKGQN